MSNPSGRIQALDSIKDLSTAHHAGRSHAAPLPEQHRIELTVAQHEQALDTEWIARIARAVLEAEGVACSELSIVLVDDATIHEMNRTHLGHDWATDVITFPLSEPGAAVLEGELVVSVETAVREARHRASAPERELALYVVHGILHLCGYDDRLESAAERMGERQEALLAELVRNGLVPGSSVAGQEGDP